MYAEFLAFEGWRVELAQDGREALSSAITTQPDVIIADTHLPGISGYELCARLRQEELTRAIPIIVITTDTMPADALRAQGAGADRVLTKPCLPEQLGREAARVIDEVAASRTNPEAQALGCAERPARFSSASKPPLSTDLA
jgi:CheY-like chemotaxis protein